MFAVILVRINIMCTSYYGACVHGQSGIGCAFIYAGTSLGNRHFALFGRVCGVLQHDG